MRAYSEQGNRILSSWEGENEISPAPPLATSPAPHSHPHPHPDPQTSRCWRNRASSGCSEKRRSQRHLSFRERWVELPGEMHRLETERGLTGELKKVTLWLPEPFFEEKRMFGFSAATSAFELCAVCALASPRPQQPPCCPNRGKLWLLTTLWGGKGM